MGKIKTAASISDLVERLKAQTGLTEAQGACRAIMVRILLGETRVQIGAKKNAFRVARKLLASIDPLHALCSLRDHRRRQRSLAEIRIEIINLADRNHTAREIQKTIGCRMELVTDTLKAAGKETLATTERGDALADSEPALDLKMIYASSDLQVVVLTGNNLRQRGISLKHLMSTDGNKTDYPSECNSWSMTLVRFDLVFQHLCAAQRLHGNAVDPKAPMPWLHAAAKVVKGKEALVIFSTVSKEPDPHGIEGVFPDAVICGGDWLPDGLIGVLQHTLLSRLGAGYVPSLETALGAVLTRVERGCGDTHGQEPFLFLQGDADMRSALLTRIERRTDLRREGLSMDPPAAYGQKNLKAVNSGGGGYTYRYDDGTSYPRRNLKYRNTVTTPWFIAPSNMLLSATKSPWETPLPSLWYEPTDEAPESLWLWLPDLQDMLFRVISSRNFARKVKETAKKLEEPPEIVGINRLATFWLRRPFKVQGALSKLAGNPERQAWVVGMALAIFGIDYLLVALRDSRPEEIAGLTVRVTGKTIEFMDVHRREILHRARRLAGFPVDPEECFADAIRAFQPRLEELVREVIILARQAFVEKIKKVAAAGLALGSLKRAKFSIVNGPYGFDDCWPAAILEAKALIAVFSAYLGRFSRRQANPEMGALREAMGSQMNQRPYRARDEADDVDVNDIDEMEDRD